MGCNCGKRRTYQAVTSVNRPRAPLSPQQSAENAIANAAGVDEQGTTPANAGEQDES